MTEVYPRVFIGTIFNARNIDFLEEKKITHIINCAHEVNNFYEKTHSYCRLEMRDTQIDNLEQVLELAHNELTEILKDPQNIVLIHCAMGISRSATVLIYFLMKTKKWNYKKTLEFVKRAYSSAQPNDYFREYLESIAF